MALKEASSGARLIRAGLIVVIILLAFLATYRIALAASAGSTANPADAAAAGAGSPQPAAQAGPSGSGACACCGGGGNAESIEGSAVVGADGVQRITVDTSNGYNPSVVILEAGTPAEITFLQAAGCLGQVKSAELGFFEDLTGGDKTVRLDSPAPGTYGFSCGMEMVFGEIVVK